MSSGKFTPKYGAKFSTKNPLAIELACIKNGGMWTTKSGNKCGNGLEFHMKEAIKLFAPNFWWNKWSDWILKEYCNHKELALLGCASSGKTTCMSLIALVEYFANPGGTSIVVSSTTMKMLERRVWGEIKMWFNSAKKMYPWLPGVVIGSAKAIYTTPKDSEDGRDERNGIFGVACRNSAGQDVGLGSYSGLKNKVVRLMADEGSYMSNEFLKGSANLASNYNFKMVVSGNPISTSDALGTIAEPEHGWKSIIQSDKSQAWTNRRANSITIQLVGLDSPALETEHPPAPLINKRFIDETLKNYGEGSVEFAREVKGHILFGNNSRVIITDELCTANGAKEPPSWTSSPVKLCGADISYAGVGGDDTILVFASFGREVSGKQVFAVDDVIRYIKQAANTDAAVATAQWIKDQCESRGIPPHRFMFDGSGRSTFTSAVMREWSTDVNSVEFGGKPTTRRFGKIICNERYDKFVSELWFAVRECVLSRQFRGMTKELIHEGSSREYKDVAQGGFIKNSVPPKQDTKDVLGFSPDKFDALVCAMEMARRLGFNLDHGMATTKRTSMNWLELAAKQAREIDRSKQLSYA